MMTALRVAVSDGTGRIDEASGTSFEVGTVVHDDPLHQLITHRALDLLLIKQCLFQLIRTLGAVAQMLSGSRASVDCRGGNVLRVAMTHGACWVNSAVSALPHVIDIEKDDSRGQCDPAIFQKSMRLAR